MFTFRKIIFTVCVVLSTIVLVDSNVLRNDASDGDDVDNETVDYYEKLINSEMEKAMKFKRPTSAKMHEPNDTQIRDFGSFDFIVIGAGSTGSVIASRLSEILGWRILLLEAGKYPNNFTMIPGFFAVQAMTEYNWGFVSVPQKTACLGAEGRKCGVHMGKGIGGSSLINVLIYSRGTSADYDKWSEMLRDASWSYGNLLNYFKKSEDFHKTNPEAPVDCEYHGRDGYLYTDFHLPPDNFTKIFLKANEDLGLNIIDFNGKGKLGGTILQMNTKHGRRFDQATAFIQPVEQRKNLIVSKGSYVIQLEINNATKRTEAVLFTKNKKIYRARVNLEVVLSAGAASSPQILMLSGIGPKNHLKQKKIPLIQDLQVGENLQNHVFCPLQFSSNYSLTTYELKEQIKQYLRGYGDLTAGEPQDGAGWYSTQNTHLPDIEIIQASSNQTEMNKKFLLYNQQTYQDLYDNNAKLTNSFGLTVVLLTTASKGTVRLKDNNPYSYPLVDSNALSDREGTDIETLYQGIKIALKLAETPAFRKIDARPAIARLRACSKHAYLSQAYWYCYIRHVAMPWYHPVGTCSSGRDPSEGVVDGNMRVFGLANLRVADASVIPFTFAGHSNAACTVVGEKVADDIKRNYNVFF